MTFGGVRTAERCRTAKDPTVGRRVVPLHHDEVPSMSSIDATTAPDQRMRHRGTMLAGSSGRRGGRRSRRGEEFEQLGLRWRQQERAVGSTWVNLRRYPLRSANA